MGRRGLSREGVSQGAAWGPGHRSEGYQCKGGIPECPTQPGSCLGTLGFFLGDTGWGPASRPIGKVPASSPLRCRFLRLMVNPGRPWGTIWLVSGNALSGRGSWPQAGAEHGGCRYPRRPWGRVNGCEDRPPTGQGPLDPGTAVCCLSLGCRGRLGAPGLGSGPFHQAAPPRPAGPRWALKPLRG